MYRSSNPLEVIENIGTISMEENKLFDENSQYVTAVLIILLTIYLYTNSVVFVIINQIKNL